jgi:ketosteroid isomerase-like protein
MKYPAYPACFSNPATSATFARSWDAIVIGSGIGGLATLIGQASSLIDRGTMYHAIVRRRVRDLFDAVNRGDTEPVLRLFASTFEHTFLGEHCLGGTRRTLSATRSWYERLYRLLPDIHFDLRRISVSGAPWNTVVVIDWDETNSGSDGVRTHNCGFHILNLRWGRATRLVICPDTIGLKATLDRLGRAGNNEALADPIVD